MWSRVVFVGLLTMTNLVASPSAGAGSELTVVSGGGGFLLKDSVMVDGGNGNDEARGISVAGDGTVFATGYVTVTGQGRNIWLGRFDVSTIFVDGFEAGSTTNWSATVP